MIHLAAARSAFGAAVFLIGVLAVPPLASASTVPGAESRKLDAVVVWVREDHIYIAAAAATGLEAGDLVTMVARGRPIATLEIERRLDSELVVGRLRSGSIPVRTKLERVRVFAAESDPRAIARLRVGIPSPSRASLLFACAGDSVAIPAGEDYRRQSADAAGERWTRPVNPSRSSAWPDTLDVRRYDEAADEEIALERGEIDVAVFWPGEPSAAMRGPGKREPLFGARSRGVLAAIVRLGDTAARAALAIPRPEIAELNRELFHGDLGAVEPTDSVDTTGAGRGPIDYLVEPSLPGRNAVSQILERNELRFVLPPPPRIAVRLAYLDVAPSMPPGGGIVPLLAVRCPVFCAPRLRSAVRALGTDRLADLPACVPAGAAR